MAECDEEPLSQRVGGGAGEGAAGRDSGSLNQAKPKFSAASPAAKNAAAPKPSGLRPAPIAGPNTKPNPMQAPSRPMYFARSAGFVTSAT